jgi:hypothetical protein
MVQQYLGDPPRDGQVIAAGSQAVTLAITLLRTGSAVLIDQPGHRDRSIAVTTIETLSEASLTSLRATSTSPLALVMTLPRAEAHGPPDGWGGVQCFAEVWGQPRPDQGPGRSKSARDPQALLDPGPTGHGEPVIKAALDLAKLAGLMPMLLVASVGAGWANQVPLAPDAVAQFAKDSAHPCRRR